jgi:hypothetical protein
MPSSSSSDSPASDTESEDGSEGLTAELQNLELQNNLPPVVFPPERAGIEDYRKVSSHNPVFKSVGA